MSTQAPGSKGGMSQPAAYSGGYSYAPQQASWNGLNSQQGGLQGTYPTTMGNDVQSPAVQGGKGGPGGKGGGQQMNQPMNQSMAMTPQAMSGGGDPYQQPAQDQQQALAQGLMSGSGSAAPAASSNPMDQFNGLGSDIDKALFLQRTPGLMGQFAAQGNTNPLPSLNKYLAGNMGWANNAQWNGNGYAINGQPISQMNLQDLGLGT